MSRFTLWPDPPTYKPLDAPPADLLAAWLPELVEQHDLAQRAVTAEREARAACDAAMPPAGAMKPAGRDWAAAVAADVAAVRRKHKPEKVAELIADTPVRYGTWHARSLVAGVLVTEFNTHAHEMVTDESRAGLVAEEVRLRAEIAGCAEEAVRAAADVGARGDDGARLQAAWKPLSALDAAAEQWRPVRSVLDWVRWARPVRNGPAWEPKGPRDWPENTIAGGRATMLGRALALRDSDLRRSLDLMTPAGSSR